jgi:hypothetical protein
MRGSDGTAHQQVAKKDDRKKSGLLKNHRPFFERRVPGVAPWRALNFGFDLQIT